MTVPSKRKKKWRHDGFGQNTVELWRYLSQTVHQARCTPYPSGTNELLQSHVREDRAGPLVPMLMLWTGDNLLAENRFDKAIAAYAALLDRYPDALFAGTPWGMFALEQTAVCHDNLGEHERASAIYGHMLKSYGKFVSEARLNFRQGNLEEQVRNDRQAIVAYRRASVADNWPRHGQVNMRDLARRHADRLESGREWVRADIRTLAQEVSRALWKRDARALEALASPTHFTLGLTGGERYFVERKAVLDRLCADMQRSEIAAHPSKLRGSGGKIYLDSSGWRGDTFTDDVTFLFSRMRDGFEWSGVVRARRREDDWERFPDPKEVPDTPEPRSGPEPSPAAKKTTPADLRMKAPFSRGENFRVGGIIPMTAQLGAIAAAWAWTGPFFPLFYGQALSALSASSACGLGPGGLWYGQPTTHVDRDNFAVDFSTFIRGIPFALTARGRAVLAIADGIVTYVDANQSSGDPYIANQVNVDHTLDVELVLEFFSMLFSGKWLPTKYSAEHLHLDGPNMIPVSVGMFLRQGARLGVIDDTGLSVADHLHFSLHDSFLPWESSSVRPTPMDGQTLEDGDDGRCMFSTNVPIP